MKKLKVFYKAMVYFSFTLLILSIVVTFTSDNKVLRHFILAKSAEFGTYLLFLMLLAKTLYFILKHRGMTKNKFYNFLRNNNMYQREQGLIVFNIIFIHIVMITIIRFSNLDRLIYYYISALIPTVVLIYMEVTSFRFFQTKISKWKKHHSIIWLTVPLIYIHILLLASDTTKYLLITLIIFSIILIEKFIGLKKGTQHIIYLLVGLLLASNQFLGTQLYNINKENKSVNENLASTTDNSNNHNVSENTDGNNTA